MADLLFVNLLLVYALTYKITINKNKIPKTGSKLVMISLVNAQGIEVSYAKFTVKY